MFYTDMYSGLMEQGPPSEADSFSAIQRVIHILRNPTAHSHVYENPPIVSALSQMDPIHIYPVYSRFILVLSHTTNLSSKWFLSLQT